MHRRQQAGERMITPSIPEPQHANGYHGVKRKHKRIHRGTRLLQFIRQAMSDNPNLNSQLMVILITLTSGSMPVDRGIDNLTTVMEKLRAVTEIVDKTMQSVKVATEAPRQIRQLLE